MAPDP